MRRRSNRWGRHGRDRAIHPKGWPNRPQDKLDAIEGKLDDARDAIETVKVLLGKQEGLQSIKEAVAVVRSILRDKDRDSVGPVPKCSFCDADGVTYMFGVGACGIHRMAFIDGKLGKNACISVEEHQLVSDLRDLIDAKYHNKLSTEIFYPDQRPKEMPKGKTR